MEIFNCFGSDIYTELAIALYINDDFVRPYVGDVLVVMLIYCFVKGFVNTPVISTAFAVLIFAFGVEMLQLANVVERFHLQDSRVARTVIGTAFSWWDLLCYSVGVFIIVVVENARKKSLPKKAG